MGQSECVVCLQFFDDSIHVPRVLACGHSLCELCCSDLPSQWKETMSSSLTLEGSSLAGAMIRCPECKYRTRLPVGGHRFLPKNIELLRLIRKLPNRPNEKENSTVLPPNCFQNEADVDLRSDDTEEKRTSSRNFVAMFKIGLRVTGDALITGDEGLLHGSAELEPGKSSSPASVSLVHVASNTQKTVRKTVRGDADDESVLKAWADLEEEVKVEIARLMEISLVCRRMCRIYGVWVDEHNRLFLVSETPRNGPITSWKTLKQSMIRERNQLVDMEMQKIEPNFTATSSPVEDSKSLLSLEELLSARISITWIRVALGLCEALMEIHSEGLVLGLLGPQALVFDQFSKPLLQATVVLYERYKLASSVFNSIQIRSEWKREQTTGVQSADTEKFVVAPVTDRNQADWNWSGQSWRYVSPEVLVYWKEFESQLQNSFRTSTVSQDSTAALTPKENGQGIITFKADVWSLGCLIFEMLGDDFPWEGQSFAVFFQKITTECRSPELCWLRSENSHPRTENEALKSKNLYGEQSITVMRALLKCLDYQPIHRPDVFEIWRNLKDLEILNLRSKGTPNQFTSKKYEQQSWVLGLPDAMNNNIGGVDQIERKNSKRTGSCTEMSGGLIRIRDKSPQNPMGLSLKIPCAQESMTLEGHIGFVTAMVIIEDYLLSASLDKTVRIWSLQNFTCLKTLGGHRFRIDALAVDQSTMNIFSGDRNGQICVWRLGVGVPSSESMIATWQEHCDWRYTGVASLVVSRDGVLYSGSGDKTIKAWSAQDYSILGVLEGHKGLVSALLVDGDLLYSGSWDGTVRVWWCSDHTPLYVLVHDDVASPMGGLRSIHLCGNYLVTGRDSGCIQVWNDYKCVAVIKAHESVITTLCVGGNFLYSGSWDQSIKAWNVEDLLSEPSTVLVKDCGTYITALVSDGQNLFVGLGDNNIIKVLK